MGPIGLDIMSFFFVLSGFVVMYAHEKTDFSAWASKREFVWSRLRRIYPVLLLNILFALPHQFIVMYQMDTCPVRKLCNLLQLAMLDSWVGCGIYFITISPAWFLSCVIWMWLVFPFLKDFLVEWVFTGNYVWWMIGLIYQLWSLPFLFLWQFDMAAVAEMPVLRLGEFLIGCGAVCALRLETPGFLKCNRFWLPFIAVILVYTVEKTRHGQDWICLRLHAADDNCNLWPIAIQTKKIIEPPCITIAEKILNKYSLIYAFVLHGLARAELASDGSIWFLSILQSDVFKTLGSYSLTLYLSHENMNVAINWLAKNLYGWEAVELRDDVRLFWIYVTCYWLHHAILWLCAKLFPPKNVPPPDEIEMLVVAQETERE